MIIPLIMVVNLVMLLTRMTKTLYIDLWNYWHFALLGVLLQSVTSNAFLAIAASLLIRDLYDEDDRVVCALRETRDES